jgi:hypothetical protein
MLRSNLMNFAMMKINAMRKERLMDRVNSISICKSINAKSLINIAMVIAETHHN